METKKEKCKKCNGPLTWIEKSQCTRCFKCDGDPGSQQTAPVVKENKNTKVDVRMTEDRVREIVRDELEDWYIAKPPVTRSKIDEALRETEEIHGEAILAKPQTLGRSTDPPDWRAQAKGLGVPLSQPTGGARKKKDVLADIEAAQQEVPQGQ